MTNDLRTILAGAAVGAALLIEHLLFYDPEVMRREPQLAIAGSNILGVGTICVGVALATPLDEYKSVGRLYTIVGMAASIVAIIRTVRIVQRRDREAIRLFSHGAGQIRGVRTYDQAYQYANRAAGRN